MVFWNFAPSDSRAVVIGAPLTAQKFPVRLDGLKGYVDSVGSGGSGLVGSREEVDSVEAIHELQY